MKIHIRQMASNDLSEVIAIESSCFDSHFCWGEDGFRSSLSMVGTDLCFVAESSGRIVGFMAYELFKNRIQLLTIGVAMAAREQGVGRAMVAQLLRSYSARQRGEVVAAVNEHWIGAQLFLQEMGFKVIDVAKGGGRGNLYVMQCMVTTNVDYLFETESVNRVWRFIDKLESERRGQERKRRSAE